MDDWLKDIEDIDSYYLKCVSIYGTDDMLTTLVKIEMQRRLDLERTEDN